MQVKAVVDVAVENRGARCGGTDLQQSVCVFQPVTEAVGRAVGAARRVVGSDQDRAPRQSRIAQQRRQRVQLRCGNRARSSETAGDWAARC